ncbi:hypothetical protein [Aquimarina aggregata]|uniref:hypothetical protein n=1 Tax=Aquimarina aggregata TaxID=1642818 RepID=UPI002491F2AE|nr:hypothetical protein [Aquimarina aggregata]
MEIITGNIPGSISKTGNIYEIEIPFELHKFNVGPKGIINISIIKMVGRENKNIIDKTKIKVLYISIFSKEKNLLLEDNHELPYDFNFDNGKDLTLTIKFKVETLLDWDDIKHTFFYTRFYFKNTQPFTLKTPSIIDENQITFKESTRPKKEKIKSYHVFINLLFLISLFFILLSYNFFQNEDVYQQSKLLDQKFLSSIIGILGAFVGLTLKKIYTWVSTIGKLRSFLKIPELHLELGQYRDIKSMIWSILLLSAMVLSIYLSSSFSTLKIPKKDSLKIMDFTSDNKPIAINNANIYKKKLRKKHKGIRQPNLLFIKVNDTQKNERLKNEYLPVAFINEKGEYEEIKFQFVKKNNETNKADSTIPRFKYSSSKDDLKEYSEVSTLFDSILIKYPDTIVNNYFIEYRNKRYSDTIRYINYSKYREANNDIMNTWIKEFKQNIFSQKKYEYDNQNNQQFNNNLFQDRESLKKVLENNFSQRITENKYILTNNITIKVIRRLLDINRYKRRRKIIERNILISGFLNAANNGETFKGEFKYEDIDSLLAEISKTFTIRESSDWRIERSLLEILFKMEVNMNKNARVEFYNFLENQWIKRKKGDKNLRAGRMADILVSSVVSETPANGIEYNNFLKRNLKYLENVTDNRTSFESLSDIEKEHRKADYILKNNNILKSIDAIITKYQ